MKNHPIRKRIRLENYDYSQEASYFITICVQNGEKLFGEIIDGNIILNNAGRMIDFQWNDLKNRYNHIQLDEYIVMPNHFHGIIFIINNTQPVGATLVVARNNMDENIGATTRVAPTNNSNETIYDILGAFKSITTDKYIYGVKNNNLQPFTGKLWQRSFYDHIIRNETALNNIREYIINNPIKWAIEKDRDHLNYRDSDIFYYNLKEIKKTK